MRHSVFAGGKRLRPILSMEAARMVAATGEIPDGAADLGAAIEMVHTYSQTPDQTLANIITTLAFIILITILVHRRKQIA